MPEAMPFAFSHTPPENVSVKWVELDANARRQLQVTWEASEEGEVLQPNYSLSVDARLYRKNIETWADLTEAWGIHDFIIYDYM